MTVAKLICSWHSTRGSVPNQEHFFRALGRSVRDLRTRKGTHADSANSAASRLLKNRFSYHDARYNDLARWNSSGLCGDATIPRDSLVGLWRRSLHLREYPFRAPANPHRIGRTACLGNHRPKDGIYTTGERSFPLHAEAAHLRLARRLVRIAARGARNERLPHERKFQSSQDRVCRRPLAAQVRHCDVHV